MAVATWADVIFGSHFDGTNGGTNPIDLKGATITCVGSSMSTTQAKFGPTAMYFNGATTASVPNSYVYDFLAGDFGISMFVYQTNSGGFQDLMCRWGGSNSAWALIVNGGTPGLYLNGGSAISTATTLSAGWNHIELNRVGPTITLYLNGTSVGTTNIGSGSVLATTATMYIGSTDGNRDYFYGYIDDVRICKGAYFNSADFTPPTSQFATPSISGVVKDVNGNFVARTVRLYQRSSGSLIAETTSNGTTGEYTMYGSSGEHYVVALDSGSENALILDHIVSV